jgi:glucosamine--fructose-6-phosphate aminotransferase (isomerizing)
MCGIVGAVARREVAGILLTGLQRLEYRGYDSAGVAIVDDHERLQRRRRLGKVQELRDSLDIEPIVGHAGIAHTRWATHGQPSEHNAHPHMSGEGLALVHNGIIENFRALRDELRADGYTFRSETDTEVIVHLIARELSGQRSLRDAVRAAVARLEGAYAIAVLSVTEPDRIVAARRGSPLVVGLGIGENYVASDVLALRPVTDRFVILEEGDLAEVTADEVRIEDADGEVARRPSTVVEMLAEDFDRGHYRHHMQKEIFEQPQVARATLDGRIGRSRVLEEAFGLAASPIFDQVRSVTIVACGTSFYAGSIARYWIEELAGIPCQVEIASEFRYRKVAPLPGSLFVTISQSGETADTLAALEKAKGLGYVGTLTFCNVATSSIVRESDVALMLEAGAEIGVASTKAFTAQLVDLLLLSVLLARRHGFDPESEAALVADLWRLPGLIGDVLRLDEEIAILSERFVEKHHALFLGRGPQFPVALEGALKLKEISYIHAEGYPAGELKHGPLALVDADMPVVTIAPNDELLEKLRSNLQEVRARGGELIVFASADADFEPESGVFLVPMPRVPRILAPILYTIPMQLLAYHVAVLKGTDVDQPRNLAKSVTVE